jgi:hypothetical protein
MSNNQQDDVTSNEIRFNEINEYDNKIVAYLRKKAVLEVREKRQEHVQYMSHYKQLMLRFLTTIFDPSKPIELSQSHTLKPMKFSVFEGLTPEQTRIREDEFNRMLGIHETHRRSSIFESIEEEENENNNAKEEHEQMMNSSNELEL